MNRSIFIILLLTSFSAQAKDGKVFNPDLSVNFLGLMQQGTGLSNNRSNPDHNGVRLQEAEIQFSSDVDVYFKAVALFSIGQSDTTAANDGSVEYGIDPEEIYLETISLPGVTVRAGKMKLGLGKHNQLHTHAYPFIDAPLFQKTLIGDEGLNETAVSAAALVPAPWFSEVTIQGFTPSNKDLFNSSQSGSVGGLVRFKNLWDFSEETTLEFGLSGTRAKNQFEENATAWGTDFTVKWRPSVGGKYHALIWNTEYLNADRKGLTDSGSGADISKLGGIATYAQYQFGERWWVQARGEILGLPKPTEFAQVTKESAVLAFLPSEFSGLRLQYDHEKSAAKDKVDHTIAFQYNITIGAHPAHAY